MSIEFVSNKQRALQEPFTWIRPHVEAPALATKSTDNTLLHLVERKHPYSARAATSRNQQLITPTIPPLRVFSISMWIHGASGTTLTLRCKDPAHDIAYCIGTDNPDRDVKLVRVDVDDKRARFTVSRGDEQHTFKFNRTSERHVFSLRLCNSASLREMDPRPTNKKVHRVHSAGSYPSSFLS